MLRGLPCAVTAYFVYMVLNLVTVTVEMDRMQAHRQVLQNNVETLQEINGVLRAELAALSSSPDLIRLYARELSLYAPGERVLRLQGLDGQEPFYRAGMVVPPLNRPRGSRLVFLLVGIAFGGMLYGWLRLRERSRSDAAADEPP